MASAFARRKPASPATPAAGVGPERCSGFSWLVGAVVLRHATSRNPGATRAVRKRATKKRAGIGCPGHKPHSRARRTTKWCQRAGRTGVPARRRGNGGVKKTDGRRKATGRPASPDHRGCLSPSGLRRRADSGGEVRRPAGSPRCARPLAFGLRADEGCRCGGTDAGGWRCSTRGTCAADGGGAVR